MQERKHMHSGFHVMVQIAGKCIIQEGIGT